MSEFINFIKSVPKTDLHVHLDGSLRLSTLIELAKEQGVELPAYTEEGLRKLVFKSTYKDLIEYLQGFYYTSSVMQDFESIERVSYELAVDNILENVRYLEVRFAPQLHMNKSLKTIEDVVKAVHSGLEKAKKEHNAKVSDNDIEFHYGIIVSSMRKFVPEMGRYFKSLTETLAHMPQDRLHKIAAFEAARAAVKMKKLGVPVVAFDLCGEEAGYPAMNFKEVFDYVKKQFLGVTIHAGEAYTSESIYHAFFECYAERIGHGTQLYDVNSDEIEINSWEMDKAYFLKALPLYISRSKKVIEVCLTSNLQTLPDIKDIKMHPVNQMLADNIHISLCTDNRLVSNTTVTDELIKLFTSIELSPSQMKQIVLSGFKRGFFPGTHQEHREFIQKAALRYEELYNLYELNKSLD